MKVLLDTNICIYLIKRQPVQVLQHFDRYTVGEIGVSSITVAELQFGVAKSRSIRQNQAALTRFLAPLVIVDFDAAAATAYGELRAFLEGEGTPIGAMDTLIAAHALSLGIPLVTNNVRAFSRVPELPIENWAER